MENIEIKSENLKVTLLPFGAIIKSIEYKGRKVAVTLENDDDYITDTCCYGATVGRTANRCGAKNMIDGVEYILPLNENGINHLHGGFEGFGKKTFAVVKKTDASASFSYLSKDGEEGYPGDLDVTVTYTVKGDALIINYRAETTKPTWVSLTNHAYFTLNGYGVSVFGLPVAVFANEVSVYDENNRVVGKQKVLDTKCDLRSARPIDCEYDHNFYLSGEEEKTFGKKTLSLAAEAFGETHLSVYTDMPCIQFYTGNFIKDDTRLSGGVSMGKHGSFCLETQFEPNFQSKGENILRPGDIYDHTTVFEFDA